MTQISGINVKGQEVYAASIEGQENDLIKKLETTTFERAYRAAYVDTQPTGFVGTCKKCWAIFWLHTFGRDGHTLDRNGWRLDQIKGANTARAERFAIKEYRSQRDNMITELANPIKNSAVAKQMGGVAEPLTSENDLLNVRLRKSQHRDLIAIPAFYKALSARVVFLNETTTGDKAKLFRAGFAQITNKIAEHNNIKGLAYIDMNWDMSVATLSKKTAREELASKVSVDDIREKGIAALVAPLDVYINTFGLTKDENVTTLAQKVFEEAVALHGDECQDELGLRQNTNYVEAEVECLEMELNNKLAEAQNKLEALVQTRKKQEKRNKSSPLVERMVGRKKVVGPKKVAKVEQQLIKEIDNIREQLLDCKEVVKTEVAKEVACLREFTSNFSNSNEVANNVVNLLINPPKAANAFNQPTYVRFDKDDETPGGISPTMVDPSELRRYFDTLETNKEKIEGSELIRNRRPRTITIPRLKRNDVPNNIDNETDWFADKYTNAMGINAQKQPETNTYFSTTQVQAIQTA